MKDLIRFKKCMAGLGEVFGKEITGVMSDVYWEVLRPFSDSVCVKAFNQAIVNCRFFPRPSELLEFIKPSGDMESEAQLAWTDVEKAVKKHGPYASVRFENKVIHGVIDAMGGWVEFQDVSSMDKWNWVRVHFIKLYPIISETDGFPDYLHGQCEIANTANGYPEANALPAPVECRSGKGGALEGKAAHELPDPSYDDLKA